MDESRIRLPLEGSLSHRIHGLELRIARLQSLDRRFSWYRLGVLMLGLTAIALTDILLGTAAIRWALIAAGLAFLGVVGLHRRVEASIRRFSIWRDLRISQRARLQLDWEQIPPAARIETENRSSLDIDLDLTGPRSLHQLLDMCISAEGSRELAAWLSSGLPDVPGIHERQGLVRELRLLPRFRDRLLLGFRLVTRQGSSFRLRLEGGRLLEWLKVEIPQRRLNRLMLFGILLTSLDAALFILNVAGYIPAYWHFTLALYAFFYFSNIGALGEFLESLVELDGELDHFNPLLRYLESFPYGRNIHLASLCAPFRDRADPPSRWLRRVKWITAGIGLRSNLIFGLALNAILPWDFTLAVLAGMQRDGAREKLKLWLSTWIRLDALISLGSFAALHPEATYPEIVPGTKIVSGVDPVFTARGLAHPLIPSDRRVGNDFTIDALGNVILITGSNMSGKSTFLKTVGINLCLAYAGAPVTAVELRCVPFRLHTCMRITDSVADGFSYFYAEVKCLRALLDRLRSDDPLPLLYLIDEIFRGTNNRERLAGSQAYTRALVGAHGAGLIATHDLELAHLADGSQQTRNYHFQDSLEDGRLAFDYCLRPGASTSTNALRIMEMEGLPIE